jgi:hypothetical protein
MTIKYLRELLAAIPMTEDHRELKIWLPNREPGSGFFISMHGSLDRHKAIFVIEGSAEPMGD